VAFLAIFLVVQWPFADFLLSPLARNKFFGSDQWDYTVRLGAWRYQYWNLDLGRDGLFSPTLLAQRLGIAALLSIASARIGLVIGNALTRVKR